MTAPPQTLGARKMRAQLAEMRANRKKGSEQIEAAQELENIAIQIRATLAIIRRASNDLNFLAVKSMRVASELRGPVKPDIEIG